MSNIIEMLNPPVRYTSDSAVIIHNDKEISFGEFSSLINKAVTFLHQKGIKENDRIPVLSDNSPEFIITIIALWQSGAIPVPLNIKLVKKELIEQIKFLNAGMIIKSRNLKDISLEDDIIIPFENLQESNKKFMAENFLKEKTALILFTSGSSGKPKAVMLSFNNLIQSALTGNKVLNHTGKDKWLASLPFYHIGGFSIIFRALMFGIPIIIPDSISTEDLIKSMSKHHPTLTSMVSSQLKKLVDLNIVPHKELRTVLIGGGFTNLNLTLKAVEQGWKIARVYGSTETSSFISFMNTDEIKRKPGASGKVIPPNEIKITYYGEIAVKGPSVMKGYFNEKDSSEKLMNGFYYTGDKGYLDEEDYLYIEAKRNDIIISGGENVNPIEVEEVLLLHPGISDVCVVGIEDEKWGQVISAAVVLKEDKELSEENLKNYLKGRIAAFKIPRQVKFVKQLPKSELGKILREKVKNLF